MSEPTIKSRSEQKRPNDAYRAGWDRIFKRQPECETAEAAAVELDAYRADQNYSSEPAMPVCELHGIEGCPP